jgi:hypothetical protein
MKAETIIAQNYSSYDWAPEPKTIGVCCMCGAEIYEGESVYVNEYSDYICDDIGCLCDYARDMLYKMKEYH